MQKDYIIYAVFTSRVSRLASHVLFANTKIKTGETKCSMIPTMR